MILCTFAWATSSFDATTAAEVYTGQEVYDTTGAIQLWIDVGLPDEKRVRRACGRSDRVTVVTYGGRVADMWWQQNQSALKQQTKLTVINLAPESTQALAATAQRNMQIQCTRQDGDLWLTLDDSSLHIVPEMLHPSH